MEITRKLEICCQDIQSVLSAKEGGADRIELCSALEIGGITPSIGLIKEAVRIFGKGVFVLIRERGGDFVYSSSEISVMKQDIIESKKAGATGVVVGVLNKNKEIDSEALSLLVAAASGMEITFHRAFDEVIDPFKSMETIIEKGCHRILTSGQQKSALEGVELLYELNKKSDGRIIILPGAGITSHNCNEILNKTGCHEIHASAKSPFHNTWCSDLNEIKQIKKNIR